MRTTNQTKRILRLKAYAIKVSACLAICYLLNSCVPCYYAPSAQNVPLLQEKKDFRISGAFKLGSITKGCDFQGALAATDHLGVMFNYSYYNGRKSLYDETRLSDSKSNMIEFGLGYFTPVTEFWVFETYGGYGSANVRTEHDGDIRKMSSKVHSWSLFVQPSFGMHKKNVEIAYSTRLRMMDFNSVELSSSNGNSDLSLEYLKNLPLTWLVEPAFTFRAGGDNVKFQMQVGFTVPLSNSDHLEIDPFNLNLGLIFCIKGKKENSEL